MRKLLTILLAMMLLIPSALAESTLEPLLMTTPDDPDAALDIIPHAPNPELFSEETDGEEIISRYEDESISVTLKHVWVGEARFNVAWVKIVDPSQLRTEVEKPYAQQQSNLVATMGARQNAVVAIGGDNYKGAKVGYILRMGKEMRKAKAGSRDALFIDAKGNFTILKAPSNEEVTAVLEGETPIINAFNFGPALVIDGELQAIDKKYSVGNIGRNEPRCAIGQLGELEYMLIVVDGRGQEGSEGCSGEVLAQYMYEQGCVQAYNLDGGNSADMYFNGGVYSHEKSTPRSLSDIIYFATLVDAGLDAEAAE